MKTQKYRVTLLYLTGHFAGNTSEFETLATYRAGDVGQSADGTTCRVLVVERLWETESDQKLVVSEDCGENYERTNDPSRFGVSQVFGSGDCRDLTAHDMTEPEAKARLAQLAGGAR